MTITEKKQILKYDHKFSQREVTYDRSNKKFEGKVSRTVGWGTHHFSSDPYTRTFWKMWGFQRDQLGAKWQDEVPCVHRVMGLAGTMLGSGSGMTEWRTAS